MEKLDAIRKLDEHGRIVLPIAARKALNWNRNILLDVYYDTKTETICLRTHENTCVYCGATQDLFEFKGQYICRSCKNDLFEHLEYSF